MTFIGSKRRISLMKGSKIILLVVFLGLAASAALSAGPKMLSIQVRKGQLRAEPSFLSKVIATLSYGDRIELYEEKEAWKKVGMQGKPVSGWIHASAVTTKRIMLNPGKKDIEAAASSDELALAGKGFNADVESEFKAKHRDIDYAWVDHMEKIKISTAEMQAFLKEGKVSPAAGGAQ